MNQSIERVGKRIRVPDRWRGKIRFGWPEKRSDGSTVFAQNLNKAAQLIVDAKIPDERAVADVICQTYIDLEVSIAMDSIRKRIDGHE